MTIGSQTVRARKYLIFLFILILFIQVCDSYTTSYTATFPSRIRLEFLSMFDTNTGDAILTISVAIATFGMYIVLVNQFLLDKLGRKVMLVITTLGMGISALLLSLSTDIIQYTIFLFLTYAFFSSDIWMIFVAEESSAEKRGLYLNVVLALGIAGPILMSVFRNVFITNTSEAGAWRGMTYFPIILGISVGIVALAGAKETAYYEDLKRALKSGSNVTVREHVSFWKNAKATFSTYRKPEIIALVVMSIILGPNFMVLNLAESYISSSGFTPQQVNSVITIVALLMMAGYFATGILVDKAGRVPLLHVYSILMPVATVLLFIGASVVNMVLVAVSMGLAYISYYGLWIVMRLILMEIVPTERRGTASGLRAFIQAVATTIGMLLSTLLTLSFGLGVTFIILSIPLVINVALTKKYIKETKGVKLVLLD